jgi:formylglycine-generating enzyme required for sulfatase activity
MMGSPVSEEGRFPSETQHRVKLTRAFMMASTVVTQSQWKSLMGDNPSEFQGDNLPVEKVSWNDAATFCKKLSEKEGKKYRLPTEAEWEYACRAGTTTAYYTGDREAALNEAGWYKANSELKTHPVGQKKPNVWGLYDMHGNVWQWCNDYAGAYPAGDAVDPSGPPVGDKNGPRVLRGGSWNNVPGSCRAAYRGWIAPDGRFDIVGLRLCLDF